MRRLGIFCCVVCFAAIALTASKQSQDIAIVLKATGSVELKEADAAGFSQLKRGVRVNSGDVVRTGEDGFAAVMFTDDKSLIKVRKNSSLTIRGNRQKSTIAKRLNLPSGEMWLKVNAQKTDLKIETPSGVAAVKGTEFYTIVDNVGNTKIYGMGGKVELKNSLGIVEVTEGETGLATMTRAPSEHKTVEVETPTWGTDDKTEHELKIEFINPNGKKRTLKIEYNDE